MVLCKEFRSTDKLAGRVELHRHFQFRSLNFLCNAIADVCELLAVRAPGVYIDSALTSEKLDKSLRFTTCSRNHPQLDILVRCVVACSDFVVVICYIHNFFSVRRYMRKPRIHIRIEGHLGLFLSVRLHPPHLHSSGAYAVEPYILTIHTVLRTVVQAGCVRQTDFLAALDRHHINVLFIIRTTEGAIGDLLSVRAYAVEVAWSQRSDLLRITALEWDCIYIRIPSFFIRVIAAERYPFAVSRDDVVVVALRHCAGVDLDQICRAVRSHFVEAAVLVDYQPLTIRSPVRSFDQEGELFYNLMGPGLEVIDLKVADYFLWILC